MTVDHVAAKRAADEILHPRQQRTLLIGADAPRVVAQQTVADAVARRLGHAQPLGGETDRGMWLADMHLAAVFAFETLLFRMTRTRPQQHILRLERPPGQLPAQV